MPTRTTTPYLNGTLKDDSDKGKRQVISKNACESDIVPDFLFPVIDRNTDIHHYRMLSLFSGCGGMDIGFEGGFLASRRTFPIGSKYVTHEINKEWVLLRKTRFKTVFANDILPEAQIAWTTYMKRFNYNEDVYHLENIVSLVKKHLNGTDIFPKDIDLLTGGFPCQDFSVAGKRMGFQSLKDDMGKKRQHDERPEETRGKLYYWMKQVIDITHPKIFVAENVKGLTNLGNVKEIIQKDFASAGEDGYIVLTPQILHAGDYGVPETRERVFFIGIRRNALRPEALKALESDIIPDEYNPFPQPTHACTKSDKNLLPPLNTEDVLRHLREPLETRDYSQRTFSRAKYLDKGQGQTEIKLDGLGPTIRSEHHGNIEFRRLSAEHGGKHFEELGMGQEERRLTPRECALIQTFPPDYRFVMPRERGYGYKLSPSQAYKIIGNAVPPVLAYHIAIRLEELWYKYFE